MKKYKSSFFKSFLDITTIFVVHILTPSCIDLWILLHESLVFILVISLTELSKEVAYDNDGAHIEAHELAVDPEVHLVAIG